VFSRYVARVLYLYVAKVDGDVAYVAMANVCFVLF
jgi:hypothetical protein